MRYTKHSYDYEINMECLKEIEDIIPMTVSERKSLRSWAKSGHSVDTNPWNYCDSGGVLLNYLLAYRIHYGFPTHQWDVWDSACYILKDNNKLEDI